MKYNLLFFFILFTINNLLHYISEKVIIVIFITFLFFLMKFVGNVINSEFRLKIDQILTDINMYINAVFNFLYINKLFYLNLRSLKNNFKILTKTLNNKIKVISSSNVLNSKIDESKNSLILFFE